MKTFARPKSRKRVAVIAETTHAAGRNMIMGISRYVREHDTWSVYYTPRDMREETPGWIKNWDGDGIIARITSHAIHQDLRQIPIPLVDVGGMAKADTSTPSVLVDNEIIGRKAAAYFLENGFHNFAFLGMQGEVWSNHRKFGFSETLRDNHRSFQTLELPSFYLPDASTSWDATEATLSRWASTLANPGAVFCANDDLGLYLTQACQRSNILIPDELALLGVDNDTLYCELCDPTLSSIEANHDGAGYQAAAVLARLMDGKRAKKPVFYVPSRDIVLRASSNIIVTEDDSLKKAIRFIQENCTQAIVVDDIAAHALLSRSVLQRRFKSTFGHTVHDRIIQERLRTAQNLLANTNLPIAEVAERTGFGQQVYLGAVFRRLLNQTPRQYRDQNRK